MTTTMKEMVHILAGDAAAAGKPSDAMEFASVIARCLTRDAGQPEKLAMCLSEVKLRGDGFDAFDNFGDFQIAVIQDMDPAEVAETEGFENFDGLRHLADLYLPLLVDFVQLVLDARGQTGGAH